MAAIVVQDLGESAAKRAAKTDNEHSVSNEKNRGVSCTKNRRKMDIFGIEEI